MKPIFRDKYAPYIGPYRLNIGCGANPEEGWLNVDFNPQSPEVIRHDLRSMPWPFERSSMDTVLASHFLEHFDGEDLFRIMGEIGDVLRVGGHLIGIVPYAMHSDAYANPFHRQLWDETTPSHFCKELYERRGTVGTGAHQFQPLKDWRVVLLELTPVLEWRDRSVEEINAAMKHQLNVIQEMQFVMRRES